jgi:ankyrin repeat protein
LQGFYSSGKKDLDSTGADPRALGVEQILSSAALGNPLAQSLAPSASASLSTHDRPDNNALQKWLVNAIRHGSIRARNEMNRLFPTEYIATIAYIKAKRFQLASLLKSSDDEAYGPKFFNQFSSLDPAAKAVLSQPGLSRLHQAAYLGALEVCKQLIEVRKLDVDILNLKKETPLHYAVRNGQLEVTQYLLDRGANINAQRDFGAGALHLAFLSYDTEAVLQLLLSKGADPHISSQSSLDEIPDRRDYLMGAAGTALHFAIRCGQIEAAKILLEVGSDPNKKFEFIFSPLQTAIQMHSMPLLEFIMPWAIKDVNNLPIVHDLYNPLVGFYAQPMFKWLYWGDETPLEFILPAVACIRRHRIGIDERVLLSWAFDSDDHRIVDHYLNKLLTKERHLLKPFRGPRVNDSGELTDSQDFPMAPDLRKVFSMILLVSSKQMIKTVLGYMDKPIPSCDETGQPLMCQLSFRQSELIGDVRAIVSMLIEAGVDITAIKLVSSQPNFGPLRNAAAWNNAVLAEVLLENHPSLAEVQGAMQVCVAKGNSKIARQIMRSIFEQCPQVLVVPLPSQEVFAQSQISQHDCNYLRAFCSRIEFSTKETLTAGALGEVIQYTKDQPGGQEALQERLAEIGLLKMTPLHHAAYSGNLDAAEILLGEGANVNAYHIFIHPGLGHDLSKATCTVDLSTLDDSQKLMLFGASGPTPLDEAYRRNWELALFQWLQSDQGLIKEIRWAGGACKEEDAYETRTQKMLEMLRAQGAKTRNELFGKPNTQEKATQMVLKKMRSRYEIKPLSDTSQRGSRFWGSACALHSAQTTQYKFPGLMNHSEPSRPRFSALFAESIEQFARVLSRCSELGEDETAFHVKEELSKYQTWARKNRIAEGDLDPIADIPPFGQSIVLAASLFVTLREVTYTLEYLEDIIMDSRDLIE